MSNEKFTVVFYKDNEGIWWKDTAGFEWTETKMMDPFDVFKECALHMRNPSVESIMIADGPNNCVTMKGGLHCLLSGS